MAQYPYAYSGPIVDAGGVVVGVGDDQPIDTINAPGAQEGQYNLFRRATATAIGCARVEKQHMITGLYNDSETLSHVKKVSVQTTAVRACRPVQHDRNDSKYGDPAPGPASRQDDPEGGQEDETPLARADRRD